MPKIIFTVMLVAALGQNACSAPTEPRSPEDLFAFISAVEKEEIRESWGEEAGECFTWADYDAFVQANRAAVVTDQLESTPQFKRLVEMIIKLSLPERSKLLSRARETARPTWAMIGKISREATTDAGRKAGLVLAGSISDAVEKRLAQR